jgi:23S rRNA (guanine745-N1)-methyltransferase
MPLVREERRVVCARGHSFDVARSGYINLLQPQERRSKHPGDTAAAIAARRRLHDRGVTAPLARAIADLLAATPDDVVLDAGCGEGFYPPFNSRCEWIVANADRFVPYADRSFSIVLSITARMNPGEFQRVLRDGGRLLVALSAPDDLIELRGSGRDRVPRTIDTFVNDTFAKNFALVDQRRVTTSADLDAAAVDDVLHSIYRPMRSQPVEAMSVTFSLDLLLFRPSEPRP